MDKKLYKKNRKIYNFYRKQLKQCHKNNLDLNLGNLDYFILELQYLRDYLILESDNLNIFHDLRFQALSRVFIEYSDYLNCIYKYYDENSSGVLVPKDPTMPTELTAELYQKEKRLHWENLWILIKDNLESWMKLDEIIF